MNPIDPIAIAHQWLKKQREDVHGHIGTWKPETMDNYHRDLGLLIDFVTDCWPKQEDISTHISPCPTCGQKHDDGMCVVEESRGDGCHVEKPIREDGL